jgi:hypothetical protein
MAIDIKGAAANMQTANVRKSKGLATGFMGDPRLSANEDGAGPPLQGRTRQVDSFRRPVFHLYRND